MLYSQFETATADALLDLFFSDRAWVLPSSFYLGVGVSNDAEVSAVGYGRVEVTRNLVNFPAAVDRQKGFAAVTFPAAAAGVDWGAVEWIGLYDAATNGTRLVKIHLGGAPVAFLGNAAADNLKSTAHGFVDNQRVRVDTLAGVALPAPLAVSTDYWILMVDADNVKLRATAGGAAIDLTVDGAGLILAWRSKGVSDGDVLSFAAGDIVASIGTS